MKRTNALRTGDERMYWSRITADPTIMQGRPCIRGMRITVNLVMNLVANGMTPAEIIREYPDLESEDITECLQYAACLTDENGECLEVTELFEDLNDAAVIQKRRTERGISHADAMPLVSEDIALPD